MLRHPACFVTLLAFALGCTSTAVDESTTPAVCSVSSSPEADLVEGGTTTLALSLEGPVADLAVMNVAGRAHVEGDLLRLRPDYGSGDTTLEVPLQFNCGGVAQSVSLHLSVRAVRWAPLPGWTEGDDGPLNREYGAMWVDPTDPDAFFAFGGFHYQPSQFTPANELWRYDLARGEWAEVEAAAAPFRAGASVALADGVPFLFGGLSDGDTLPSLFTIDTSATPATFDEVVLNHDGSAVGDYQPSFVYDAPRDRFVTACGANATWGMHCRVRIIDPSSGAVSEPELAGPGPEGRGGQFWVHDEAEDRLIVFSGFRSGGISGDTFFTDTWALELAEEPMRWVKLAEGDGEKVEGRRNGVYVLDPVGHRMFVWGGTPDGMTSAQGLFALDLERGHETWERVEPAGEVPPARASGQGIYDAGRKRIVAGFGNGEGGLFADLWSLSL